ncbi:T9SS type A sorting domain-containing protein, partial [Bacteroidota bacterium]
HRWLTFQAWELLKETGYPVGSSFMNKHFGRWEHAFPERSFEQKTIMAGAFMEDEEEIVYDLGTGCNWIHTCTHFWNADITDNHAWIFWSCEFPNAYMKTQDYWTGVNDKSNPRTDIIYLELKYPVFRFFNGSQFFDIRISYTDITDVYLNPENVYVTAWKYEYQNWWANVSPWVPVIDYLLERTYFEEDYIRLLLKGVSWEIVGRICHLIQDMSVPAHANNDSHLGNDYYEDTYVPPRYMSKNWTHAFNAGGVLNINELDCPLRTMLYTTNQLADRFPSNDYGGDANYTMNPNPCDADFINIELEPLMADLVNVSTVPHYGIPTQQMLDDMDKAFNYSYVYAMRATAGFLWYVFNQFEIEPYPCPHISHITQVPSIIRPGDIGILTAVLSPGGNFEETNFNWAIQNPPDWVEIRLNYPRKDQAWIKNNYSGSSEKDKYISAGDAPNFNLSCYASRLDCSNSVPAVKGPVMSTNSGGCPWVYVLNEDGVYEEDNNILHKSEFPENNGIDITDRYKLMVKPDDDSLNMGHLSLKILEDSYDHCYFDNFKLYAVDHPLGTRLGVTEGNVIVVYDSTSIISTDDANLNGDDITDDIQFFMPPRNPVDGDSLDNIYAHYRENMFDNAGVITELKDVSHIPYPIVNKDVAGHIGANTSHGFFESYFARREREAEIIIPIGSDVLEGIQIEDLSIDYLRNFGIKYISLAEISTDNYISTNLVLLEAINSEQNTVAFLLDSIDQQYAEIDTGGCITLYFFDNPDNSPPSGYMREYILETTGRYDKASGSSPQDNLILGNKNKETPLSYKLYNNYPNPFNPVTQIKYQIPKSSYVSLKVYDLLGREIATLVKDKLNAGNYEVVFNGSNLASGVYIYKLQAGDFVDVKKMVLIK